MAHVDVVTADPEAWAFPPFEFGKRDGYYFGRGTQDNKTGKAGAIVNCRILPGRSPQDVQALLAAVIDDSGVQIDTVYASVASPPSELSAERLETLESLVEATWPGLPIIPQMSAGASDGVYVRNAGIPVYGVSGWFLNPADVRAHGLDEKVSVPAFHQGAEFWYRMLKAFSGGAVAHQSGDSTGATPNRAQPDHGTAPR